MAHVHPGAKTTDLVRHITDVLNGTNPEKFHGQDIIFMSMFNDAEWTKKNE